MEVTNSSRFRRICVFRGSSLGNNPVYDEAAVELGKELVSRSINLDYGGGSIGLRGNVSKSVQSVGEVRVVCGMHQRKAKMARHVDAFIALPGGYGTFEEILEAITWTQLGFHHKPVGLLNVNGFYNWLLYFIDKAVADGLISPSARRIIVSAETSKQLMEGLEEFVPEYDEITASLV